MLSKSQEMNIQIIYQHFVAEWEKHSNFQMTSQNVITEKQAHIHTILWRKKINAWNMKGKKNEKKKNKKQEKIEQRKKE